MAELLNLNKARKAQAKARREAQAKQNRVRFGRTKAEKAQDEAARSKAARVLDGARRDCD